MLRPRVLVLCHDVLGESIAGPGIRYQNIARILKKYSTVKLGVLVGPGEDEKVTDTDVVSISTEGAGFHTHFNKTDIIFAQWLSPSMIDYAKERGIRIIFDLYAPVPVEFLASLEFSNRKLSPAEDSEFAYILEMYKRFLEVGDFFTCSNERQRDFWIGYVMADGALKPTNFRESDILKRFAICPMGIDSVKPHTQSLKLRQALGLSKDDFVLLWTGGIWDWFDAQAIIKAVAAVKNPRVKLVFLGTKHPNSKVVEMEESKNSRKIAEKLRLVGKRVFFLEGWVPHNERASYFLDADIAIYADKESLETRFSHRTRVLDHIWTSLPTICSAGDYMSEIIDKFDFGIVVEGRDPKSYTRAINEVIENKELLQEYRSNITKSKHLFTWENTLAPLVEYIGTWSSAPRSKVDLPESSVTQKRLPIKHRVRKAAKILIKGQQ